MEKNKNYLQFLFFFYFQVLIEKGRVQTSQEPPWQNVNNEGVPGSYGVPAVREMKGWTERMLG